MSHILQFLSGCQVSRTEPGVGEDHQPALCKAQRGRPGGFSTCREEVEGELFLVKALPIQGRRLKEQTRTIIGFQVGEQVPQVRHLREEPLGKMPGCHQVLWVRQDGVFPGPVSHQPPNQPRWCVPTEPREEQQCHTIFGVRTTTPATDKNVRDDRGRGQGQSQCCSRSAVTKNTYPVKSLLAMYQTFILI